MSGGGTTFGRYELQELLAVGGMAEIFVAKTRLGGITRTCVIKRILPEYSTSRPFVSMFIDEARITIGLEHEHIVKLIDFGQVDGAYFMAIEYVDGCDLVEVLRAVKARREGVPALAAAYIASCMARGLHAAHTAVDHRGQAMNIVHRDVSPQNVFLSWQGAVKIGDFGIASARNKLHGKTVPGTIKGKYGYMSPSRVSPRASTPAPTSGPAASSCGRCSSVVASSPPTAPSTPSPASTRWWCLRRRRRAPVCPRPSTRSCCRPCSGHCRCAPPTAAPSPMPSTNSSTGPSSKATSRRCCRRWDCRRR